MKSKDQESSQPLEAYYAAPKTSFEELLDISEWGTFDKIVLFCSIPLVLVFITFVVLDMIGIEFNRFIDGAFVVCVWLIVVVNVWMSQKKTEPDGKPTPKRWYFVMTVCYSIIGLIRTISWLVEHF
ncbi:MAG: hypothetical protein F4X56_07670 [Gammaproteobacteria bacterium]|nr:hypothetical protein [Gammaproteobacteria bacterium]